MRRCVSLIYSPALGNYAANGGINKKGRQSKSAYQLPPWSCSWYRRIGWWQVESLASCCSAWSYVIAYPNWVDWRAMFIHIVNQKRSGGLLECSALTVLTSVQLWYHWSKLVSSFFFFLEKQVEAAFMHQLKAHDGLSHVLSTWQCTAYFTVLASSFSSPAVLPGLWECPVEEEGIWELRS